MEVESAKVQHASSYKTIAHKSVPRWLRMSLRVALLVGVVALPALAVKDSKFEALTKYRSYSIAFMVLGILVLPIWEPNLGQVVVIYTLLIPMACASIWLAYGLFVGFPNLIFMMGACVVVTFIVLFTAELLSMPAGLLSVFTTIFVACANVFMSAPRMAMMAASLLSVLLFVAAFLATLVCWLVFPEFCVDEVIRYHHEGLEHLMHLAHYALNSKPPPLCKRVVDSSASSFGEGSKWRKVFSSADEQAADAGPYPPLLQRGQSGLGVVGGLQGVKEEVARSHAVERSWQRVHMALQAANKAQVGAKAEVVIAAVAHKRIIVPCVPLIPCANGQIDEAALKALQHVAVATSLHIYKLFCACNPLDEGTEQLMHSLMSSEQWNSMRAALLASLQEVVDAFPMDYYPAQAPDGQYMAAFQAAVERLAAAWSSDQLAHKAAGFGSSSSAGAGAGVAGTGSRSDQHAVTITPEAAAAAAGAADDGDAAAVALGDVFRDPLVPAGSAAAGVLARLHMAMLVRMLKELVELLQQLCEMATAVSNSMLRFKCC